MGITGQVELTARFDGKSMQVHFGGKIPLFSLVHMPTTSVPLKRIIVFFEPPGFSSLHTVEALHG